jgi:hypothetical protein
MLDVSARFENAKAFCIERRPGRDATRQGPSVSEIVCIIAKRPAVLFHTTDLKVTIFRNGTVFRQISTAIGPAAELYLLGIGARGFRSDPQTSAKGYLLATSTSHAPVPVPIEYFRGHFI